MRVICMFQQNLYSLTSGAFLVPKDHAVEEYSQASLGLLVPGDRHLPLRALSPP